MNLYAAVGLWFCAAIGLTALALQLAAVWFDRRRKVALGGELPPISVLKPLCGVDDELAANLEAFATLRYPRYEVLLGVKDARDSAYPVARAFARQFPGLFRVVLQDTRSGLNPKVNQLITLARAAAHGLWVVSDSNARVDADYLLGIAAQLEDPQVGCVTHPVGGMGHQTLGSLMDNLHLASSIGPGMIASKRIAGKDLVVGKSMAFRKADLDALGGFEALKDYLAEDYVFGGWVRNRLGKRVAVSPVPVQNISQRKSVGDFFSRYLRWSVIHRTAVQPWTYCAEAMLNPWPITLVAAALWPAPATWLASGTCLIVKAAIDVGAASALSPGHYGWAEFFAVPLKDLLLAIAWVNGLLRRTVVWRGNVLRVEAGSRLVPLHAEPEPAPASFAVADRG